MQLAGNNHAFLAHPLHDVVAGGRRRRCGRGRRDQGALHGGLQQAQARNEVQGLHAHGSVHKASTESQLRNTALVTDVQPANGMQGICELSRPSHRRSRTGQGPHLRSMMDTLLPSTVIVPQGQVTLWEVHELPSASRGGVKACQPSIGCSGLQRGRRCTCSAAACSAAFLILPCPVKTCSSNPPKGVCTAGAVSLHAKVGWLAEPGHLVTS